MTRLGKATVSGITLLPIEEIVTRLEAVSAEDVTALARELLDPSRLSAAGIGPSEDRFRDAVERVNPALLQAA
jgi:predicted Zn-dependent peptidase